MQLDFFRQLKGFLSVKQTPASAPQTKPPQPTPPKMPAGTDPALEALAHKLLTGLGCDDLAAKVRVVWNPRMRSTAGTAQAAHSLITLNPRLREFGDAEIDRTLRHELAHLLAHHRAGRRRIPAHGPEWRRACRDLGLPDEKRCHELPLPRRAQRKRHFYRCPSCQVELARVRPLRQRSACLTCCRKHSGGRYDDRFRFEKLPSPKK
jgi:predicted SprT family Zn-dependent metalloprotease